MTNNITELAVNLRGLAEAARPGVRTSARRPIKDLTGMRFGMLSVNGRSGSNSKNEALWTCVCDCGKTAIASGSAMRPGAKQSCGCKKKAVASAIGKKNVVHGHTRAGVPNSPTYKTWCSMLYRCNVETCSAYVYYGAKGTTVCDRWLKFTAFLEDMGERPEGMTIDRKDNAKGYFKENCKWSTCIEQQNNRTSNVPITAFGKTQTISQWSRETGLHKSTIRRRFHAGKDPELCVTAPSRNKAKVKHHD